jgi:hypothetical protein
VKPPRTVAGWTIAVFGVLAIGMGAIGLIRPEILLVTLGFEVVDADLRPAGDYTLTFMTASSMASFNMGVYYLVAAHTEWRAFFRFTVAFRVLTFLVFTASVLAGAAPVRFLGVALWEGVGALATGFGLWYDRRRGRSVTESGS